MTLEEVTPATLREIRERHGLSQTEIGEIISLDVSGVSRLEAGHRAFKPIEKAALEWYFFKVPPPGFKD